MKYSHHVTARRVYFICEDGPHRASYYMPKVTWYEDFSPFRYYREIYRRLRRVVLRERARKGRV